MLAVLFTEITDWNQTDRRRTLGVLIGSLVLVGYLSMLRPAICAELLVANAIWLGFLAGKQSWNKHKLYDWVTEARLSVESTIGGKILGAFSIHLIHLGIALPVLIIMTILWGISGAIAVQIILLLFISCASATGLGLIITYKNGGQADNSNNYFVNYLVGFWLILTALIPTFRLANPFYEIWKIMKLEEQSAVVYLELLLHAGIAVVIFWLTVLRFRREVKSGNEN